MVLRTLSLVFYSTFSRPNGRWVEPLQVRQKLLEGLTEPFWGGRRFSGYCFCGRLIFIHLQCWEVLPFFTIQRQCIKILRPKDPEFYTPLPLNCQKGQRLPAPEVYKNQSPILNCLSLSLDRVSTAEGVKVLKGPCLPRTLRKPHSLQPLQKEWPAGASVWGRSLPLVGIAVLPSSLGALDITL